MSLRNDNLIIQQDEGRITVPLQDIATIVLEEGRMVVTRKLLEALTLYKIVVFICDSKHMPSGIFLPLGGHCRQLKILRIQINLSVPFKKRSWQFIIAKKIVNQAVCLKICKREGYNEIEALSGIVKSGDSGNIESYVARKYFHFLFASGFKRDSSGWINSALNYGYAILRGALARSLVKYGFHPALGIHHRSELNPFNLADDFLEPFRPLVDLWAFKHYDEREELSKKDRQSLYCLLNVEMLFRNKHYSVLTVINETIKSFSSACEKNNYKLISLPSLLPLKEHSYE